MAWGREQITKQAVRSAREDFAAFEAIGLERMEHARVLDVGCFDGFNTHLKFAPYRGVEQVVGIDPFGEALDRARQTYGSGRFLFEKSSFEEYPEREHFDLVYFSHTLQHLEDPKAALAKAHRLLKPGGFVIVKATDDGAKVSHPDPERAMAELFALYERHILRATPWTAHTDRYFGRKCYPLLKRAGFANARIALFTDDTAEKTLGERRELFERCVYFRRSVPSGVEPEIAREIACAVERFGELFERDDYYFSTTTYVAIGQKLEAGVRPVRYAGSAFGASDACCGRGAEGDRVIRPMCERDVGEVMRIELDAFVLPWTPLAFLAELRYNEGARYTVLVDGDSVVGYMGMWLRRDGAWITRIAVDSNDRRKGGGAALVADACEQARARGMRDMLLEVRASNAGAIAFYRGEGFAEIDRWAGYYTDPVDDAIVMCKPLC